MAYIRTQVDTIGTVGDYSAPGGERERWNDSRRRRRRRRGDDCLKSPGRTRKCWSFAAVERKGIFKNAAALIMGNILYDQDGAGMQEILESNWEKVGLARLDAFDTRAKTESLHYKIVLGAGFLLSGMEMIGEDFEGTLASAVNDKSIGPTSNGKVGSLSKGEAEDLGYFAGNHANHGCNLRRRQQRPNYLSLDTPKAAEERNWLECTWRKNMGKNLRLSPSPAAEVRGVIRDICSKMDARTI